MIIRSIQENDSQAFLELCQALDDETQFMMLEPGERDLDVEKQRQRIFALLGSDNQTILVAELDGLLAGYLGAFGGDYRRNRHCAYIVIGIRQAFAGQGIGQRLFAALEEWAAAHGIRRLELTVMAHNTRAVRLYQKMGFESEGLRRDSLCVDGRYVDEYAMAKIIGA